MPTAANDLRIGSLFSGYGGLDLAVESVFDATTAWVADIDPGPRKILAHRFPHAPNLGDVTAVDWAAVEPVDIIAGGTPCQDVSHAGRRAGFTEGTRSNLWTVMREAIAVIRPKLVVWENVRGVMSAAADSAMEPCPGCVGDRRERPVLRAFGRVLGDLAELGYDAQWHGVRASDVGAAHGRWRVFVIAHPQGDPWRIEHRNGRTTPDADDDGRENLIPWGHAAQRPSVTGDRADSGLNLLPPPRATDGTKGGPNQRGSSGDLMLPSAVALLPTPTATPYGNNQSQSAGAAVRPSLDSLAKLLPTPGANLGDNGGPQHPDKRRAGGHSVSIEDAVHGLALLPTPLVGSTSPAAHGQISGQWREQMANALDRWGDYAAAIHRHERMLGRAAPSPTEQDWDRWRKARAARFANRAPVGHRGSLRRFSQPPPARLSARFAEWMMCLSDGWVCDVPGITRNEALKALGNGVVPVQAEAALRHMLGLTSRGS